MGCNEVYVKGQQSYSHSKSDLTLCLDRDQGKSIAVFFEFLHCM